jgi:hypothetical protein
MFEENKKRTKKQGPLKRSGTYKEVSGSVIGSCYVASAVIAIIAVSEAVKSFSSANTSSGAFYVALAVLGVLFSVFITVVNRRNKKRFGQKNGKKK